MAMPRNVRPRQTAPSRTYRWRGEDFPSVTAVLATAVAKPALTSWAARQAAEYAVAHLDQLARLDAGAAVDLVRGAPWRRREEAADLGSLVHEVVEASLLGLPRPEVPPPAVPYVATLDDWLRRSRFSELWAVEATVYNRRHRYAGTTDFVLVDADGRHVMADVKTGRGVYGEVALQLAAYRHGEFVGVDGTEVPLVPIDRTAVLHLRPTRWEWVPVRTGDEEWRAFRAALALARWRWDHEHQVLGEHVEAAP